MFYLDPQNMWFRSPGGEVSDASVAAPRGCASEAATLKKGISEDFRTPPHKVRRTNTAPEDPSKEKETNPAKRVKTSHGAGNEAPAKSSTGETDVTEASVAEPRRVEKKQPEASEPGKKKTKNAEIPKSTAAKSAPAPKKTGTAKEVKNQCKSPPSETPMSVARAAAEKNAMDDNLQRAQTVDQLPCNFTEKDQNPFDDDDDEDRATQHYEEQGPGTDEPSSDQEQENEESAMSDSDDDEPGSDAEDHTVDTKEKNKPVAVKTESVVADPKSKPKRKRRPKTAQEKANHARFMKFSRSIKRV